MTLEADLNEAQEISTEEVREEALDFVGPCGTPDDGYKVSFPADELSKTNFYVSQGSMYVGGLRVVQSNADLNYLTQPEWLDRPDVVISPSLNELVYLYLREQEVSAVEDSALREVALGGPDTAQRTRLVQHIERINVEDTDTTSAKALATATELWSARGFLFEPSTMRLRSKGQLKAGWTATEVADLCAPATPQGYLGDENQLIRVQVSALNKIIWGYDNASFLYRATRLGHDPVANTTTFALASIPVDERHRPRGGQAVEILGAAAEIDDGVYMAAASGQVTTVSQAYDTRTQTIVVNNNVGEGEPVLFVRVWEKELPLVSGPIVIGPYGLEVTLTTPDGGPFTVGDYWLIAVRPSTPSRFYPARLASPQPPDGPRRWACPLAVIGLGPDDQPEVIVDCREPFDNLVELTKRSCCECNFRVSPVGASLAIDLQAIIDGFVSSVGPQVTSIVVCFDPGTYALAAPLRLDDQHTGLTLDGGKGGVVLKAAAGQENAFLDGLISMISTTRVTLRGLELELPIVDFIGAGGTFASLELQKILDTDVSAQEFDFDGVYTSLGVRLFGCASTTVRDCTFHFPTAPLPLQSHRFGAGILAQGSCVGLAVEANTFVRATTAGLEECILLGFMLTPSTTATLSRGGGIDGGTVLRPVLDQASLSDNTFSGLTGAALVIGDLGSVNIERNRVKRCYAGFWLMSLATLVGFGSSDTARVARLLPLFGDRPSAHPTAELEKVWSNPLMNMGGVVARAYPRPIGADGADLAGVTTSSVGFALNNLITSNELLRRVEASLVVDTKALVLRFANNDVDTTWPEVTGWAPSAATIAVWDFRFQPATAASNGSAIISENRLVSNAMFSAAVLVAIEYCTVTGNLIHGRPGPPLTTAPPTQNFSLIHTGGEFTLVHLLNDSGAHVVTPPIAVTGNVLQGLSCLPRANAALELLGGWPLLNHLSPTP